jgi:multidrug resistance efflux pump
MWPAGSQLLYLIPQQTWVIANFKETQIANMRIGQKAWFTVDAMKHKKFTGHVEQISPAAGSEFSVLKPIMRQETLPKSFNGLLCVLPLTQIRKE